MSAIRPATDPAGQYWRFDPKRDGPAYDLMRDYVKVWASPKSGITRDDIRRIAKDFVREHGLPISVGEVEMILTGLPPSISGCHPKVEDDGIGWRVSMTTADPVAELALRVKAARNGPLRFVEATVNGVMVARDSIERLDSMNQREFVAAALGKRCGWGKDTKVWLPLVDAAVAASHGRAARTGETWTFDMAEAMASISARGPGYVATPFARPGNDSVIYGPPGRAKTKIVHGIDVSLANAKEVIPGVFDHVPADHEVEPVNVLHVQLENDRNTVDGDILRIAKGAGITTVGNLHIKRPRVPFLDAIEEIAEYVKVNEIDHLSIDSVQTAIGASGASAGSGDTWGAAGEAYFDALDAIRHLSGRTHLSTLSIDHAKGQPEVIYDNWADRFKETLYGSSRKYARFRAAFLVLNLKGRDSPAAFTTLKTIGVFNHKEWPDLPRADNAFIEVAFDNAAFSTAFGPTVEPAGDGSVALRGVASTLQTALGAARHPLTVPELLKVLPGKPSRTSVQSALERNAKVFVNGGITGWGLVAWGGGTASEPPNRPLIGEG